MEEREEKAIIKTSNYHNVRNSFTLIELLIVLFIMLLVYSLSFYYFLPKKNENINLFNLKEYLIKNKKNPDDEISLICFDREKECDIFRNGKFIDYLDFKLNFKVYSKLDPLTEKKFEPFFYKSVRDVKFRFDIYPNNSNSFYFVKINNKIYYMSPIFGLVKRKKF